MQLKKGDFVKMTNKYMEYEQHKNETFKVVSDLHVCCGTEVVCLEGYGVFAVDGLIKVRNGFTDE